MITTPEDKKKELIKKFSEYAHTDYSNLHGFDPESQLKNATQCAIICVEEILRQIPFIGSLEFRHPQHTKNVTDYWQSVLSSLKEGSND